jgi:Thermostable 8-oxoguanine DNA glycosylase
MNRQEIREAYREKQGEIKSRLEEFEDLRDASNRRLFRELVFVILTSRSEAEKCWEAANRLEEKGLLLEGGGDEIEGVLRKQGVSYEKDKAGYIVENRQELSQPTLQDPSNSLKMGDMIDPEDLQKTRKRLVEELKGVGWKTASHFLRNVGYGDDFAILSGYIAKKLHQLGITGSPEPPGNREEYMEMEQKFRTLAKETGIGVRELDLVLWSMETGEVFR